MASTEKINRLNGAKTPLIGVSRFSTGKVTQFDLDSVYAPKVTSIEDSNGNVVYSAQLDGYVPSKHIIGVIGYAGSGKDTVGAIFTKHGYRTTSYAKALKAIAISLGWNGKKDKKGRRLLQLLGTDVCRQCISDSYWVDKALITDHTVVTDVRFANEAEHILSQGGMLVVVDRKICKPKWYRRMLPFLLHESECYHKWIGNYPHTVITNNGTLEELEAACRTIL